MTEEAGTEQTLSELRKQHRKLEEMIEERSRGSLSDLSEVQRLKKQKLALKDRMAALQRVRPDLIA